MNIYEMVKQLKGLQQGFEEVKETLRSRKEVIERDGVLIVFNGLGEILDIDLKDESLKEDWGRLKTSLMDLINEAQSRAKDIAKEELSRKFGGILGGLGFGV